MAVQMSAHMTMDEWSKVHRLAHGAILKNQYTSRYITTEKSYLCQYAVCITRNTMLKK